MPRSTIALCDIHSPLMQSFQKMLLKRSSPSCLSVAIIPCIRSSSVPMDPCTWTLLPRPILAKRRTGNPRYTATIREPNLRLVAASGIMTPKKTNQMFSPAERYATGIRNAEGFAFDSTGRLFVTQPGRDQLRSNWPELYKPEKEATQPAEELMLLKSGGHYGWPECSAFYEE